MKPERVDVLGVPVDCVDMSAALARADTAVENGEQIFIAAVNPEKVIKAAKDETVMGCLQAADLLIPDGIGVVVAVRWLYAQRIGRVAGADLMPELCALAARRDESVFLLGAKPAVNEQAAAQLVSMIPGLTIAGRRDGYFAAEDDAAICEQINDSGATFLFVAMGSPAQELWVIRHRDKLKARVIQGIGGTLDVLAGQVQRAPPLWRRLGLEWLYRLLRQPGRLFRQAALPKFAFQLLAAKFRGGGHPGIHGGR